MATIVPVPPQIIEENHPWRDWFQRLRELVNGELVPYTVASRLYHFYNNGGF